MVSRGRPRPEATCYGLKIEVRSYLLSAKSSSSPFLFSGWLSALQSPCRDIYLDWCLQAHNHSTMTTPHVIASSSSHPAQSATSNGIVGSHYRVGKKIGEGSFGVVFEGAFCLFLQIPNTSIVDFSLRIVQIASKHYHQRPLHA